MTPEYAHDLGKKAAEQLLEDGMGPVSDGSIDGIVRDLEFAADHSAPRDGAAFVYAFKALFMRGAAEHFRGIGDAIEQRATLSEVTR